MPNEMSTFEFDYSDSVKTPVFLEECLSPAKNEIFRHTIDTYHSYVKYTDSPTRNLRWLAYETKTGNLIGAVGLASAVIAISCRDDYIGWDKEKRLKNLGMLANNSRCCFIQNNITIKNVGSQILKHLSIEGVKRWKEKYGQQLVMLETFVQPGRDEEYNGNKTRNGAIYRASNWVEVGMTSGNSIRKGPLGLWVKETGPRGELARTNPQAALEKYGYEGGKEYIVTKSPVKIMFVRPLVPNWKKLLNE